MRKYPKIPTVWQRDPDNNFKTLIANKWASDELSYLAYADWIGTEKVDGTNIRVHWDGEHITFGGRTDQAEIPTHLLNELQRLFPRSLMRQTFDGGGFTLFGEGYGNKIQKVGKHYLPDKCSFILFDVFFESEYGVWLTRESVESIADKLHIGRVPVVFTGSLPDLIDYVREGFPSEVAETELPAEGVVMRPVVELLDRTGARIITKVKYRDFGRLK